MKHLWLASCLFLATASLAPEPSGAAARTNDHSSALTLRPAGMPADSTLPGIQALDAKNGFRGYTLGAPITQYPGLKRRSGDLYEARNEPLKIGDVRLLILLFGVEGGRLTSINFITSGKANATKLLASLQAQYGAGEPDGRGRVRWRGAKVGMVYDYTVSHSGGGSYQDVNGSVTMYSLEFAQAAKKALGEP